MSGRRSRKPPAETTGDAESTAVDRGAAADAPDSAVDEGLKRRLREAYLNDEEDALVVTAVRLEGDEAVVETRPPHGEATHVERFDAPTDGSLEESEELLSFLEVAGVSPLDLDELVGTRIPATYDPDRGWRIAADVRGDDPSRSRLTVATSRSVQWAKRYRDWLLVLFLVGGELLFVVVVILLFT
ncbi:MAG: hypothetical protein PPP55_00705 [Halorubrum sp.]